MEKQLKIASTVFLGATALSAGLAAQAKPVADLAVEIIEPLSSTTPGTFGGFGFRLTNHGPDPAGSLSFLEYPISAFSGEILELPTGPEVEFGGAPGADCLIIMGFIEPIPGDPPRVDFSAFFRPLQPGENVHCQVFYHISGFLDHELILTWRIFGSLFDEDPNPDNDEFVLVFNAAAADIPTLTPTGSMVLIVSLSVAFIVVRRKVGGI